MPWYAQHVATMAIGKNEDGLCSRHEAVMFVRRKPVARSCNHMREFVFGCRVPSTHAEVDVIRSVIKSKTFRGRTVRGRATILVVRRGADDELRNSAPCRKCRELMQMVGIKNVVYSNDDGEIVQEAVSEVEEDHYVTRGYSNGRYSPNLTWRVSSSCFVAFQRK